MDKQGYMQALKHALEALGTDDIEDILADYENHFDGAYEEGLSDVEIIKQLGQPETIAAKYIPVQGAGTVDDPEDVVIDVVPRPVEESPVQRTEAIVANPIPRDKQAGQWQEQAPNQGVENVQMAQPVSKPSRSPLGAVIVAGLLIFLNLTFVIGPYIGIWGLWIGGFVTGLAFIAEGIKMIVLTATVNSYSVGLSEVTLVAQIGLFLSAGTCITLLMIKAAKGLGMITKRYTLWNVKLVKGEA